MTKTEDEKKLVTVSRITLLAIALASTVISLLSSNIINVIYVAGLFYGVAVFLPLVLGLASRRITAGAALLSMIAAVAASLLWEYDLIKKVPVLLQLPSNVVGLAVSGAVLCLFVLFQKKDVGQTD